MLYSFIIYYVKSIVLNYNSSIKYVYFFYPIRNTI